jgi:hypothetical protein
VTVRSTTGRSAAAARGGWMTMFSAPLIMKSVRTGNDNMQLRALVYCIVLKQALTMFKDALYGTSYFSVFQIRSHENRQLEASKWVITKIRSEIN